MLRVVFVHLLSCLLLVSCCDGSSLLYVRPDNYTLCPDHGEYCLSLSEYAQDLPHYLGLNITLVFLPGHHILESDFHVSSNVSSALTLIAYEPGRETQITCTGNATFAFEYMDFVMFADLDICCGSESVYGGITTDSVVCVLVQGCVIRDSLTAALNLTNTSLVSSGSRYTSNTPDLYNYHWLVLIVASASFSNCTFANNSGKGMFLINSYVTTSGTNTFANNHGGAVYAVNGTLNFTGNTQFINNSRSYGGAVLASGGTLNFTGNTQFINNSGSISGAVFASGGALNFTGSTQFINNSGSYVGAVFASGGTLNFTGNTQFINNGGPYGGAVLAPNTTLTDFTGNTQFINNSGSFGAAYALGGTLSFTGNTQFINNSGSYGGAVLASNITLNFTGNTTFSNNAGLYRGAVYAVQCSMYFCENSTTVFVNNTAVNGDGGALSVESASKLIFSGLHLETVWFQGNTANRGGALYIQDSNPLTYCLYDTVEEDCFYEVHSKCRLPPSSCPKAMYFENNEAKEGGHALYGGNIANCVRFNDTISTANDTAEISSDPYRICACNDTGPDCNQQLISYQTSPGASITLSIIALGQRNGPASATILAIPDTWIQIGELESTQVINNTCTNLTYTIFGAPGTGTLALYAGGPCQKLGSILIIKIEVLKYCPPGFQLTTDKRDCECDHGFHKYMGACNNVNKTITRDGAFWVGYDQDLDGVILYPNCPFDYCVTMPVTFVLEDYNAQCRYNRTGILCGGCTEGLSLLLGSSRCGKCSNSHLGLLVFFAVAGVLLVVFLLTFNLTVAVGTIYGLIFYANIVASSQAIFFPKESTTYVDFLKVFIAWINLDFGIETCFYNGMYAYSQAWLQYAFPTYIWSLIVLVFVVSHFSQRASRILGSNPVAVLATLILLSYTKILRIIIEALHSATLEYPHGHLEQVWIYDGNVAFFGGRHLVLFVFSILVLIFLFIPYTLLLLTSQWLLIKSHWKILSWLNKPQLRAFLDAYHAPYKPEHRYWTGLLLLVRFVILLVSAVNVDSNPTVNLLVVFTFVQVVLAWQWASGGVYRNWYLDILDSFFLLNLVFLVLTTYNANYEPSSSQFFGSGDHSPEAGTATLVMASLVVFVGIVVFHGYLRVRRTATWKSTMLKITRRNEAQEEAHNIVPAPEEDSGLLPVQAPTRSYVTLPEL